MKRATTLIKQINNLYLELTDNYSDAEICEAIIEIEKKGKNPFDWFIGNLYDACKDNVDEE